MVLYEGRGGGGGGGETAVAVASDSSEFGGFPGGGGTKGDLNFLHSPTMLESSPLSLLGKLTGSGPTTSEEDAEASFADRAERAERHLLARDFEAARDIAMRALDSEDLGREDFDKAGAIRLSFVLGQALFELGELTDADKKLRRIYGSFTMIPDLVVVLWVTLLAHHKKERDTLKRFTEAFVKVNKKRLGKVAGGTFLVSYIQLVLLGALDDPEKASSVLDVLKPTGKEEKALKQKLHQSVEDYMKQRLEAQAAEKRREESEVARAGRSGDMAERVSGRGEVAAGEHGENSSTQASVASHHKKGSVLDEFVSKVRGLEKSELVAAGLVGSTFLYALYSERKSIRRATGKAWSKTSAMVQAFGRYLVES